MTDTVIREYRLEDIPALIELWLENFDDTREFAQCFYNALPDLGHALVAEREGAIVGASHILTAQELYLSGGEKLSLALVYGVSVAKSSRRCGIGEKLVKASHELSQKLGADVFCCEPASAPLVLWYEKVSGLFPALRRVKRTVAAAAKAKGTLLNAEEYASIRENLLSGLNHVVLSPAALSFEENMLSCYEGAFIHTDSGIATAYMYGSRAMIRELICVQGEEEVCAAQSAAVLGATDVEYCLTAMEGSAYILTDKPLPADTIWNLSFS